MSIRVYQIALGQEAETLVLVALNHYTCSWYASHSLGKEPAESLGCIIQLNAPLHHPLFMLQWTLQYSLCTANNLVCQRSQGSLPSEACVADTKKGSDRPLFT